MKLTVDLISKTNKSKTFLVKFKKDNLIDSTPSKVSYEVIVNNDTLEFKYDKKELDNVPNSIIKFVEDYIRFDV